MRRLGLLAEGADGEAAGEWLENQAGIELHRLDGVSALPDGLDVVWIHATTLAPSGLLDWVGKGGRLLLTLEAAEIPFHQGIEPVAPDERLEGAWRHQDDEFWLEEFRSFKAFPHIRGLAAFGPHPLFAGIDQGTYTWAPTEGERFSRSVYRRARPGKGSIVAVERSFIHLNDERAIAWEHAVGDGGVLCIGAFVHPASPNRLLARQLHAVLWNAIGGDAIPHRDRAIPVATWPLRGVRCIRDSSVPVPALPDLKERWASSVSHLTLEGNAVPGAPWTLGGRRILLAGTESGGLAEAWAHPFRIVKAAEIFCGGQIPVAGPVRISPDQVVRSLAAGSSRLTERFTTALERPLLLWDFEGDPGPLEIRWQVDLRRMWPYPAGNLGDLRWNIAESGDRLWIGAAGSEAQVIFALSGGRFEPPVEHHGLGPALELKISGVAPLRIIAVAASDSPDLETTVRALERKKLDGIQRQRSEHAEHLGAFGTGIETPDPDLAPAFEWAKVRTDSFVADVPGVGRSLLAGYAPSREGWGDGRPGYAWFFGRDACWTAFAQLAVGQREAARDVIRFLSRHQDVSGKILHEYTTSGLVHYDAADSTPLYLLLAGRFAAWTGETDFLRKYWSSIEKAYRFCLETDTDADGLIENSGVGHGWIEHGPLGGAHVTLYLAACWVAALESLAPVAEAMGRPDLGDEMRVRAREARSTIAQRMLVNGEYALGLFPDGTPQVHRTAMLSVPLLLGVADPNRCVSWLDDMARPGFSTPWGVRMIPAEDPLFDPRGYHAGAVWPLYTGWVSLAEWKAGRYPAALDHLLSNARLYGDRARGAFDEVLDGRMYRDAGVCPDQAWSAAMVLSPMIEGMWGVVPDALDEAVLVSPWLPPGWTWMTLRRLRVGRTVLDIELRRKPGQLTARIMRTFGPGIQLKLSPRHESRPAGLLVDGIELAGGHAQLQVSDQHEIIFFL